jgi:hypothetical protein
MDLTNTTQLLLLAVIALIVIGLIAMAARRAQRTKRLQEQFGPEYERAMDEVGNKREAERELEERIAHVEALHIRTFTAAEVNRYALEWQKIQTEFVDEPTAALQKADRLIQQAMKEKGYPVDDFEQRAADISVDYPELVADYRAMHRIASKDVNERVSTEDLRQAMIHGRSLFENLIQPESKEGMNDKERI